MNRRRYNADNIITRRGTITLLFAVLCELQPSIHYKIGVEYQVSIWERFGKSETWVA